MMSPPSSTLTESGADPFDAAPAVVGSRLTWLLEKEIKKKAKVKLRVPSSCLPRCGRKLFNFLESHATVLKV